MSDWINPNDNIIRLRLTEAQYAKTFIENGTLKFSTPHSWAEYSKTYGDGRGDYYEGTFAFCHIHDFDKIKEFDDMFSTKRPLNPKGRLYKKFPYNNRVLYKDTRSMQLPCFCLYVLKISDFDCPRCIGNQKLTIDIPSSYFKDFVDNKSDEDIEKLPPSEKPSLIQITDFAEFLNRLTIALKKLGVLENEIRVSYVTYFDFEKYGENGWYDFGQKFPTELFVKGSRFEQQKEARIIINTTNKEVLEKLKKPINIGNLSDIAQICNGYFSHGLSLEMTVDLYQTD